MQQRCRARSDPVHRTVHGCVTGPASRDPSEHALPSIAVPGLLRPHHAQQPNSDPQGRDAGPRSPVPRAFAMLRHGEQIGASHASPAGYLCRFTLPALPAISCGATLALGGTTDSHHPTCSSRPPDDFHLFLFLSSHHSWRTRHRQRLGRRRASMLMSVIPPAASQRLRAC